MNNDIVIRLAQEAGLPVTMGWIDSVLRFAVAIAEVERQACAELAATAEPFGAADLIRKRGQS